MDTYDDWWFAHRVRGCDAREDAPRGGHGRWAMGGVPAAGALRPTTYDLCILGPLGARTVGTLGTMVVGVRSPSSPYRRIVGLSPSSAYHRVVVVVVVDATRARFRREDATRRETNLYARVRLRLIEIHRRRVGRLRLVLRRRIPLGVAEDARTCALKRGRLRLIWNRDVSFKRVSTSSPTPWA